MPTPRIHWAAYFWPGLSQLWMRGSWAGLLVAVGFTALANVLLLATWVYTEWLDVQTQLIGYSTLAVVWLLARWQSRAARRTMLATEDQEELAESSTEQPPTERDQLFRAAQGHYLRNDWVAAEQVLLKLLKQDARDVESRLMLATLWRHQGRGAEALRQLDRLQRLEAASHWQHEIAAERMAIEEADNEPANAETESISDALPEQTEVTPETDQDDDYHRQAA